MSRLKSILSDFVNDPAFAEPANAFSVKLGEQGANPAVETARQAAATTLDERLKSDRRSSDGYFLVCVAMVVLLFLVEIVLVLTQFDKPELVKGAVAAFGVGAFGLILLMVKLWGDRNRIGLILALGQSLEPADMRDVLHALLEQQYGKGPTAAASVDKATSK
jgi:hypothetical protein